jgi:RNA polymerase sigma-70 factor (ECF subfamily)
MLAGRDVAESSARVPGRESLAHAYDNVLMRMRSDAKLVQLARHGSRDAAAELFSRHWPSAWRAAYAITGRRELADDVAQDAFERAFSALARFDERRPFGPWLYRIVFNRCLDLLRTERRMVAADAELARLEWHDVPSGDRELLDAVAGLSLQRRVVLVLRYGLGYTPSAIAELLDLPTGTVNSRLARALEDLRVQHEVNDAERA